MPKFVLAILASTLVFSSLLVNAEMGRSATDGLAVQDATSLERLAGPSRYATAAAVAGEWKPGLDVVYVARGDGYADALVAAAVAGRHGAPLLLTRTTNLPADTASALRILAPDHIIVVGGSAAISDEVVASLGSLATSGKVRRVAQADRYGTAVALTASYPTRQRRVYLASGEDYPDALAAAALANHEGVPLLITPSNHLDPTIDRELERLAPREVVVVGGEVAVSERVARQAAGHSNAGSVRRLAGRDRYTTAATVAGEFAPESGDALIVSGEAFPDALVAAPLGGTRAAPVLLASRSSVPKSTQTALRDHQARRLAVVGGPSAISQNVADAILNGVRRDMDDGYRGSWGNPTWRDEFSGSHVDSAKWRVRNHVIDGNKENDWAVIDPSAVTVDGGSLHITAEALDEPVVDGQKTRYWSTGFLDTRNRHVAQYGRWEIRAALPTTRGNSRGAWPAFWLRNSSLGEIDILESWGDPAKRSRADHMIETSNFTAHESTRGDQRRAGWYYEHQTSPGLSTYSTAGEMHTWALEYTPKSLRAYFDGKLAVHLTPTREHVSGTAGDYSWIWGETFTSTPWEMRLNLQMGDAWYSPDPKPSQMTRDPVDFTVDYVRYWPYSG